MKKLLILAFILSLIISCDKEETDPYKDFWGFHVKDTTGLKLFQAKQVEDVNYLVGLRDKKLWIGKFDNDTKVENPLKVVPLIHSNLTPVKFSHSPFCLFLFSSYSSCPLCRVLH